MSQFAGYVLPGTVFIAFGLKWALDASSDPFYYTTTGDSHRYNEEKYEGCRLRQKHRRHRRICRCCPSSKEWPVEGVIKLIITAIGIGSSIAAAFVSGKLQHVGDILYATVYLFFSISGLVDVLIFYCPFMVPFGLDKFSLALAFAVEGLMFNMHLGHQAFMEQQVHVLLVCAIYSCSLICLVEIVLPWSQLVKFCRAFTTLVHGSWYIQSGFILYNPAKTSPVTWSSGEDFNSALVWISLTFAWHCAGAFVILLCLLALSRKNVGIGQRPPIKMINADSNSKNDINSDPEVSTCPLGEIDLQSHCRLQLQQQGIPVTMSHNSLRHAQSHCPIPISSPWPSGTLKSLNLKS